MTTDGQTVTMGRVHRVLGGAALPEVTHHPVDSHRARSLRIGRIASPIARRALSGGDSAAEATLVLERVADVRWGELIAAYGPAEWVQ